jgi:hypothetical protein
VVLKSEIRGSQRFVFELKILLWKIWPMLWNAVEQQRFFVQKKYLPTPCLTNLNEVRFVSEKP